MISTNIHYKKAVQHPIRLILKKIKSKRKNGHGQNFIHDLQFLQYLNANMALVNSG
jgi:hypothetical protein